MMDPYETLTMSTPPGPLPPRPVTKPDVRALKNITTTLMGSVVAATLRLWSHPRATEGYGRYEY